MTEEEQYQYVIKSGSITEFKNRLRNSHCQRCLLSSEIEQNPTTSRGNTSAKVMMVGEAPGHNEMLQGIPFVGRAGQLMDNMMESVSVSTNEDVYVTNICRCRPVNNRAPKVNEARTCITYLEREIELLQPNIILTLGATSSNYLLGDIIKKAPMQEIVGRFFQSDKYLNIDFFVLYHPAALLYNPNLKPLMIEHLETLKKKLNQV